MGKARVSRTKKNQRKPKKLSLNQKVNQLQYDMNTKQGEDKYEKIKDDNNKKYRLKHIRKKGKLLAKGAQFNKKGQLKPSIRYQSGEHNYISETDDQSRIVYVKAKELKLKKHSGREAHAPNTPEKKKDDHAGHLIGDVFGGSPKLDNLLSQASTVNLRTFKRHENLWRAALLDHRTVKVKMWIEYPKKSKRPSRYHLTYQIISNVGSKQKSRMDSFVLDNKN